MTPQRSVGPVGQDGEPVVDLLRFVGWHRQDVHCLVKTGEGVQVVSETHADTLKIVYQLIPRKMLQPVEIHMLHEMRQSLLVIVFEDRTRVDGQSQLDLVLRLGIVPDKQYF